MLLGELEVDGYSSGRQASDSIQGNAVIWEYGLWDVSCLDAPGGESDLGDWGGGAQVRSGVHGWW